MIFIVRQFLENVESTKTLKISLDVLDNDALMKKLNESTINIHTVEIQSTCEVHKVLRKYSLPSCVKVLRMNENSLNLKDISDLVRCLCSVSALHELDLCRTKFKESSFFAFICLLNNCKDLRSLILTDNGLTEPQITGLVTAFESMKNLKNLNLSNNNLTETQVNDILQKHGQAKNILSLDLSQNSLQGNDIVIGICQLQSLEELNLSHNHIRFFPLPNLVGRRGDLSVSAKVISLSSNHMTPDDISQFCSLIKSDVLKFILDFNHIGNSIWSLCSLGRKIEHLKVLSLASTDICSDVDGLAALLSLVSDLEDLDLSSNNLMAKDFKQLQSPLSKLTRLKSLNFSGNRIVGEVLEDDLFLPPMLQELIFSDIIHGQKLFVKLKRLENLRKLHLNKVKLRAWDVEALATMLPSFPNLEELSLARLVVPYLECGTILSAMKSLTNIKKLNLSGIRLPDDRAMADMLSSLLSLEELALTDMIVGNMEYERLFANELLNHLRKLNFGGVKLRDARAFFDMLPSLSNLEEIVFPDVVLMNASCLTRYSSSVESLRYLKNLDLGRTKPASEALAGVLPSLQLLEKLVLELDSEHAFDNSCNKQLFGALGKLKYLKELHLRGFGVTSAETLAEVLPSLQLLEKFVLELGPEEDYNNLGVKQLFGALGKLKYLKELNLGDFIPIGIDAETLAEVLPSLQLLEKLVLKLGPDKDCDNLCVKQLFGALGKLKYLKELNLKFFGASKTSAESLVEVLPSLQLLEKLVLGLNPEEDYNNSCVKQLFRAVGKLKYLKELYLKCITETDAESLAEVLPSLQLLQVLKLGWIFFYDGGGKQLFDAMGKLKYLKNLKLKGTLSTGSSVANFAEALPSLHCLEKLSLRDMSFKNGRDHQIFAAIESLRFLNELVLSLCPVTQTGTTTLISVLPKLHNLKCIELWATNDENKTLVRKLREVASRIP